MAESVDRWRGGVDWNSLLGKIGMPGGADIIFAGPSRVEERVSDLALVALMLQSADRCLAYQRVVIITPPVFSGSAKSLHTGVSEAMYRLRGTPMDDEELVALEHRLLVQKATTLEVSSIVELLRDIPSGSFIIVVNSTAYRKSGLELVSPSRRTGVEEDLWVPHLYTLTKECEDVAVAQQSCIILDCEHSGPGHDSNLDLLRSVEHCSILTTDDEINSVEQLLQSSQRWIGYVKIGRTDLALELIDALPDETNENKAAFKIQALNMGGNSVAAIELLKSEVDAGTQFDPSFRVRAAYIAEDAGSPELARKLLTNSVSLITSEEWLEQVLVLSRRLSMIEIEKECEDRLANLFPNSIGLRDHYFVILLQACMSMARGETAPTLRGTSKFVAFGERLIAALNVAEHLDYESVLLDVNKQSPEFSRFAQLVCATHAKEIGCIGHAMALAKPAETSGDFARHASRILLWGIELALLGKRDSETNKDLISTAIIKVLTYLSQYPNDTSTRVQFERIMSVQIAGTQGIVFLAHAVLLLASKDQPSHVKRASAKKDATEHQFKTFFESALSWCADNEPIIIGDVKLPRDLVVPSADALFDWLIDMFDLVVDKYENEEDLKFIQKLVMVATATAPHTSSPEDDLYIIRVAASKYVNIGQSQTARDYAELGLAITHDNTLRQRLAWFGYADTYQRLRNTTNALIGMGCALSCHISITKEQKFYETYGMVRLLRELGMLELAETLLPTCEALISDLGLQESMAPRIQTIRLSLRFRALGPETDTAILKALADDVIANLREVLNQNDEIMPIAIIAAQIYQLCNDRGVVIDADARALLDRAADIVGTTSFLLLQLTGNKEAPTAEEVFEWLERTEAARYSEDVGYDIHVLARAARRLLTTTQATSNPDVAMFAAELTTDHGVNLPGQEVKADERPAWLPSTMDQPADQARAISRRGLVLSMLAMNDNDRLVRISAQDGELQAVVVEDEHVFSKSNLTEWSKTFPYDYGFPTDDPNIFYNSTRSLGLTQQIAERTVIILDTDLQKLPPNLLVVENELLGVNSATAVAPSLAWLHTALEADRIQRKPPIAWISTATEDGDFGTLQMLSGRLETPLHTHNIPLVNTATPPPDLKGAELAIIAAHGGIGDDGRYFQVVSDEDDFRVNQLDLANALANSGVVILFVCSGGRFDKHPMSSTAVALPKELLDKGCSAIVASPWPLDASVPAYWLPSFLDAWYLGAPVIDATYQANQEVAKSLGESPEKWMAMTVYGNPLASRLDDE